MAPVSTSRELPLNNRAHPAFVPSHVQVFIDKAEVLHVGLASHFDQFGQQSHMMREIDQELCHHTGMAGWDLKVWPIEVCGTILACF